MRTLRLPLAGAVSLALLGVLSGAVVGQDEDAGPNAWVTGVGQGMTGDPSEVEWSETDSGMSGRGFKVVETVEWSDRRLPSEFRSVGNLHANEVGTVFSTAELWEGPDGDWTGRWTGACDLEDNCWGMTVLTGQRAYEGLSAVIVTMAPEDPGSSAQYRGFIFEGELPPMPDPVEPIAEPVAATAASDDAAAEGAAAEVDEEPEEVEAGDALEDAAQTPVYVTGTEACTGAQGGSCTVVDGVERCRGFVSDCVNTMSDPRVSGTYTNTYNHDCLDERGCLFWGTHVLDGPDGGWDCSWSGLEEPYPDAGNDGLVYVVCRGTGAYEGLTYVSHHAFGGAYDFGDGTSFHGLIYADELPSLAPPFVTES
jgi:hypothetical protein